MNTPRLKLSAAVTAGAVLIAFLALPAASQVKPAAEKYKLEELVGDYVFEAEGQIMTIRFSVEQGKLFGAPPDETPEELKPVKDQPLCFDVTTAENGEYYLMKFVRNEKGVFDTCIMNTGGMEIVGKKVDK